MKSLFSNTYIAPFFALAFAASVTSCSDPVLRGKGDTISETRTVGTFDKITAGGEFEIYLTQGPAKDILLEGQENILAELETTTRNNKLEIEFDRNRVKITEPVKIYITTPTLSSLSFSGSNKVTGLSHWQVNDLKISTSGSATVDMTIAQADELDTHISGSGEMTFYGAANHLDADISGAGKIKAYGLQTKTADISISGSGRGEVNVSDNLKATISGSGKVRYMGNPSVNSSISGSGSVSKAN